MNAADVIAALHLPSAARLDRRVPKKLLIENGSPTSADKRRINAGVEELVWVAALKSAAIGVLEYRDDRREYPEIAVLSLVLRESARPARLVELVHRAIPYPVLLVTTQAETVSVSVAHKRIAQNEPGKVVLDGPVMETVVSPAALGLFNIAAQPKSNMLAFYQGWTECLEATQAGQITGHYSLARDPTARREALAVYGRLVREIARLRARAERESQVSRRVELNLALRKLEAELAEAKERL